MSSSLYRNMPPGIHSAWVNIEYSRSHNEKYPTSNPRSPKHPYFTDRESMRNGQWIRVVMRPTRGKKFWGVGTIDHVPDIEAITFHDLAYEGGAAREPPVFESGKLHGKVELVDNEWKVIELISPLTELFTANLAHPDGRRWSVEANGEMLRIEMVTVDKETIVRTRSPENPRDAARELVQEQIDTGFVRRTTDD